MKLVSITPANYKVHKYKALFIQDNGRKKTVKFGAAGMKDYTIYSKEDKETAEEHRKLYLARNSKREDWNSPLTAGALSRWILWEEPTLPLAIASFRKRFDL